VSKQLHIILLPVNNSESEDCHNSTVKCFIADNYELFAAIWNVQMSCIDQVWYLLWNVNFCVTLYIVYALQSVNIRFLYLVSASIWLKDFCYLLVCSYNIVDITVCNIVSMRKTELVKLYM